MWTIWKPCMYWESQVTNKYFQHSSCLFGFIWNFSEIVSFIEILSSFRGKTVWFRYLTNIIALHSKHSNHASFHAINHMKIQTKCSRWIHPFDDSFLLVRASFRLACCHHSQNQTNGKCAFYHCYANAWILRAKLIDIVFDLSVDKKTNKYFNDAQKTYCVSRDFSLSSVDVIRNELRSSLKFARNATHIHSPNGWKHTDE